MWNSIPTEIISIIYAFDGTKREKLNTCLNDIRIKGCISRMTHCNIAWAKERNRHTDNFISYRMFLCNTINDSTHLLTNLSKCSCCSKHQCNRPSSHIDQDYLDYLVYINNVSPPDIREYREPICSCLCRHACRQIHGSYF